MAQVHTGTSATPRKSAAMDLDQWNLFKLDQVTSVIDAVGSVLEGCKIWIRPSYKGMRWRRQKMPRWPVIHWVDHRYCWILNELPFDDLPLSGEDDSAFSYLPCWYRWCSCFYRAQWRVQILVLCWDTPCSCHSYMSIDTGGHRRSSLVLYWSAFCASPARRNVSNSSDYSIVRHLFYIVLPFLIVPLQILVSNPVFHTHAWLHKSYYKSVCSFFCIDCTEVLSCTCSTLTPGPLQDTQTSTPWHQSYAHHKAYTNPPQCWKSSLGYYTLESCSSLSTEQDT